MVRSDTPSAKRVYNRRFVSFHDFQNSLHLRIKSENFAAVGARYIQERPDELVNILCMLADFIRLTVLARSCWALSDQLLAEQCCGSLLRMLIFQRERPGHRQRQCYFPLPGFTDCDNTVGWTHTRKILDVCKGFAFNCQ